MHSHEQLNASDFLPGLRDDADSGGAAQIDGTGHDRTVFRYAKKPTTPACLEVATMTGAARALSTTSSLSQAMPTALVVAA
jgi:hypothetical protein